MAPSMCVTVPIPPCTDIVAWYPLVSVPVGHHLAQLCMWRWARDAALVAALFWHLLQYEVLKLQPPPFNLSCVFSPAWLHMVCICDCWWSASRPRHNKGRVSRLFIVCLLLCHPRCLWDQHWCAHQHSSKPQIVCSDWHPMTSDWRPCQECDVL